MILIPHLYNANPGGTFNTGFITVWGNANKALDANGICTLEQAKGRLSLGTKWMTPGVKPVVSDKSGAHEVHPLFGSRWVYAAATDRYLTFKTPQVVHIGA